MNGTASSQAHNSVSGFVDTATKKPLLFIAVILLNSISIFTNQLGFSLIWREGSPLIAWAFAISIGLFLIHLTFEVAAAQPEEPIAGLITGYMALAVVSIFFNFNAFYSNMAASDLEVSTRDRLTNIYNNVWGQAEACFVKLYHVDLLDNQKAAAQAGMEYEEKRPDLPGAGPRYRKHLEEYEQAVQQENIQIAHYQESIKELPVPIQMSHPSRADTYNQLHQQSGDIRAKTNQLISKLRGQYGFTPVLKPEEASLLSDDEKKTDLWFSLSVIGEETEEALRGDWRRPAFLKAFVALMASLLIDLPIFIAVVFSHRRRPLAQLTAPEPKPELFKSKPEPQARKKISESEEQMWAPSNRTADPRRDIKNA